jgi:hypothetical protein
VAEGRYAGDEQGQRQRLAGQIEDAGADVLAEQEQAQESRGERIQDGEPGLGRRQRARRHRVGCQQHGQRPATDQDVQRPAGDDGTETIA